MFRSKGALVFVLATVSILLRNTDAKNIGIAFGGGGFKSVADQTALTAGLLAELMRRDEALREDDSISSPLASSELYKEVKSLSTISGGSWFTSYLVYSINYRRMVEEMAKQAATGADKGIICGTFYESYGKRFDALRQNTITTNDIQRVFLLLEDLVSPLATVPLLGMFVDNIKSSLNNVVFFSQIGSTDGGPQSNWFNVTNTILGDDINQMTLGSEVQEWSKGKSWNIITSTTTMSNVGFLPKDAAFLAPLTTISIPFRSNIWANRSSGKKLSYSAEDSADSADGGDLVGAPFVPVLFSVVLGNEGSPPAPLPTKVDSVAKKLSLIYSLIGRRRLNDFFNPFRWLRPRPTLFNTTVGPGIEPLKDINKSFAAMPIVGPVAASSAAIGFTSVLPDTITDVLIQVLKFNPNVGFACKGKRADPSLSFLTGLEILNKLWSKNDLNRKDFNAVTENGVCNYLDGGATDPFGIATALASGADEIFCVNAIPDLVSVRGVHFGYNPLSGDSPVAALAPCFIFDRNNITSEETHIFDVEAGRTVKEMKLETFTVNTKKNDYFGIEEGRTVTLHVFSALSTEMSTGAIVAGSVEFKEIGDYIEDIMSALVFPENKEIVDKILMALGTLNGSVVTNE